MSEKKEFPFKTFERLTIGFALLSFLSFIISIIIFLCKTPYINVRSNIDPTIWSNFGSFLSGAVGSVFSIATVFLLFMTYKAEKKELEETRKVLIEQSTSLKLQQFETTFFKLLDNHSTLVKNFDGNLTPNVQLDSWTNNLKGVSAHYNYAINTKRIVGVSLFNYNPFNEGLFEVEFVRRIIEDINHISNFLLLKSFLKEDEILFYFTTLFNSLFDSEKYLYGFLSDLGVKVFLDTHSEKVNSAYNSYYKQLPNSIKIKSVDQNKFYPAIDLHFNNGHKQINVPFTDLDKKNIKLILKNNSSSNITLSGLSISKRKNTIESGFKISGTEEYILKPNYELQIDLFEFINETYFDGKITEFLTQSAFTFPPINKILEELNRIADPYKNFFVLHFSVRNEREDEFKFYTELVCEPPRATNSTFTVKFTEGYNSDLVDELNGTATI